MIRLTTAIATVAVLSAAVVADPVQVSIDVTSGWVSSYLEPSDWGPCVGEIGDAGPEWTQVGFYDDDWGAVLTPINDSYRPPSVTTAELMWDPSGAVQAFMRHEFTLQGTPLSGVAHLWGDDNWEFYVNGTLADTDRSDGSGDHPWGSEFAIREVDITSLLVFGDNVFAIRGMDGSYCNVGERGGQKVYFEAQIDVQEAPALSCTGFGPPMANYPVKVKGNNRALPLKADLWDADGYEMTDLELTAPPVIQVWFKAAEGGDPIDVTDDALSPGMGDDGNQCYYDADGQWHFNLKTSSYTSPGTYTVTLESGDDGEYLIEPTCETQFVIR